MDERQTAALVRRIEREQQQGASGRRGYSAELRWSVLAHVERMTARGRPRAAIARELGIAVVTLDRWAAKADAEPFHEVEVLADRPPVAASATAVVRLPDGTVVEGLAVDEVVALLRGLR